MPRPACTRKTSMSEDPRKAWVVRSAALSAMTLPSTPLAASSARPANAETAWGVSSSGLPSSRVKSRPP